MTSVEELYKQYGPMVYRRCYSLLRCADDAQDMTQDVFVRILGQQDLKNTGLSSYLWTIATNLCLNRIRDRKRRGEDVDGDELLLQIAVMDDHDARIDAGKWLGRLFDRHPENSREIAVMHFLDCMSYEEVAHAVGMSVSGVRKRLASLRATLNLMEAV